MKLNFNSYNGYKFLLSERAQCIPLIKWDKNLVQNDQRNNMLAETQSKLVACPQLCPTKVSAASKPKQRARKLKPKEIKPKKEDIQMPTSKQGAPKKRNVRKTGKTVSIQNMC